MGFSIEMKSQIRTPFVVSQNISLLDGYCAYYLMAKVASCSMLLNLQTLAILHTSEPPFHLHNTLLYKCIRIIKHIHAHDIYLGASKPRRIMCSAVQHSPKRGMFTRRRNNNWVGRIQHFYIYCDNKFALF